MKHNKALKGSKCPRCNGTGTIYVPFKVKGVVVPSECPDCHGTGLVDSPNACSQCGGSGHIIINKFEAICPRCGGSGIEPE